jgi:gliding motility-associated-like protein
MMMMLCLFIFQLGFAQGNARNNKPKIKGQSELSTGEDQTITVDFSHLRVEDENDWFYPWGFTLKLYEGANYTFSGPTVTPAANFNGILTVPVTVNDGEDDSEKFDLKITVNPINDAPTITGQNPTTSDEDKAFTLLQSHLLINDPDDSQFTLTISPGTNYTVTGNVITPAAEFSGTLSIHVKVSDGKVTTENFNFQLQVKAVNDPPKIIGQENLNATSGVPFALALSQLTVTDIDNAYPTGFSLIVLNGNNYTVSGTQITPAATFTGELLVNVKVSDGTSESETYSLKVNVQKGSDKPLITNQTATIINEDEAFTFTISLLKVSDADSSFPKDFTYKLSGGTNYTISNSTVVPTSNFSGTLLVPVTVSDGTNTSDPYNFQITVRPVNDAPVIQVTGSDSLVLKPGADAAQVFANLTIIDPDHDSLTIAEVGFDPKSYEPSIDALTFINVPGIRGVFDSQVGILALIGKAPIAAYIEALKSVRVAFVEREGDVKIKRKSIYALVNDGLSNSNRITRFIRLSNDTKVSLEIPTGFTPNGDFVNDTWSIKPTQNASDYKSVSIKIYSKTGLLVFEASGLTKEWDGRHNGTVLPADVYFYVIDLKAGESQSAFKGIVTILR